MRLKFDKEKLEGYLKDFYELTHMRVVLFDSHSKELCAYPPSDCPFCARVQGTLGLKEKCLESNAKSFEECKRTNRICVYKCHASLMEVTAALKSKGILVGYAMMGQCSDIKNKEERYQAVERCFLAYGKSVEDYKKEVSQITYKTEAQFKSAAKILEALTNYLLLENYISLNKERFVEELDAYIEDHLKEAVPVDDLCRRFSCGRTKLYESCSVYLNMAPAKYVTYYKMEKAKKLLLEGQFKVVDVAFALGYEDANYFSRLFKKATYLTPMEYKEKHQG